MGEKTRTGMSRREFARRAAIASAVASLAPVQAVDAGLAAPAEHAGFSARAEQGQQPPNMPKLSPESQAEVEARFQTILGRYGSRFSEEQKADIKRLCTMAQPPLDRLRAYAVGNSDGPALYLKPLVEREKKPAGSPRAASAGVASPAAKTPGAAKSPGVVKTPSPGDVKTPLPNILKTPSPDVMKTPLPGDAKKP
jgi:hypothetical protein